MNGLRWVSAGSFTVAVGVAVNQALNDSVWNWWALGAAVLLAVGAAAADHFWNRATDTGADAPPPGKAVASGERSVAIGGDNTGVVSTGDGAAIEQNP